MSEWVEIYERLPPEGELVMWVLPADKSWPIVVGRREGQSINWGGELNMSIEPFVTHWMPLPDMPPVR